MILFASSDIGFNFLKFLVLNYSEDIDAVITTSSDTKIIKWVQNIKILLHIYDDNEKYFQFLSNNSLKPNFGMLVWWPKIVSKSLINSFSSKVVINTHPSLLPYNRGKHPNFWAIVEKCSFGVTLHLVDEGIDTGMILFQEELEYSWVDTGESLYNKALVRMELLLKEKYPLIRTLSISPFKQPAINNSFHYASELHNASRIDLNQLYLAEDLLNKLRARTFKGHPACWFKDEKGDEYEVRVCITKKQSYR